MSYPINHAPWHSILHRSHVRNRGSAARSSNSFFFSFSFSVGDPDRWVFLPSAVFNTGDLRPTRSSSPRLQSDISTASDASKPFRMSYFGFSNLSCISYLGFHPVSLPPTSSGPSSSVMSYLGFQPPFCVSTGHPSFPTPPCLPLPPAVGHPSAPVPAGRWGGIQGVGRPLRAPCASAAAPGVLCGTVEGGCDGSQRPGGAFGGAVLGPAPAPATGGNQGVGRAAFGVAAVAVAPASSSASSGCLREKGSQGIDRSFFFGFSCSCSSTAPSSCFLCHGSHIFGFFSSSASLWSPSSASTSPALPNCPATPTSSSGWRCQGNHIFRLGFSAVSSTSPPSPLPCSAPDTSCCRSIIPPVLGSTGIVGIESSPAGVIFSYETDLFIPAPSPRPLDTAV
mmetsp:Transcript_26280/g.53592  ORF Transcript_26280/g.53592 Transcript_26280/m.53592 type:complete len:395 (-) Transcript_26280:36-1220(-)